MVYDVETVLVDVLEQDRQACYDTVRITGSVLSLIYLGPHNTCSRWRRRRSQYSTWEDPINDLNAFIKLAQSSLQVQKKRTKYPDMILV